MCVWLREREGGREQEDACGGTVEQTDRRKERIFSKRKECVM